MLRSAYADTLKKKVTSMLNKEGERSMRKKQECEVCWAGRKGYDEETPLYKYKGSIYCEQDLDRAITEGWHNA